MKNNTAFEKANEMKAMITQIFWMAVQSETTELKDFLSDLKIQELKKLFPKFDFDEFDRHDEEEFLAESLVHDHNYVGFIAEVHLPTISNVIFDKKGNFSSCLISYSISRVDYVYAETLLSMITKVEKLADEAYEAAKKNAKKNNKK